MQRSLWNRLKTALAAPPDDAEQLAQLPPAPAIEAEPLPPSERELLDEVVREMGQMRIEWAETLDKINRWASRQAARQRKEINQNLDAITSAAEHEATAPSNAPVDKSELRRRAFALRVKSG